MKEGQWNRFLMAVAVVIFIGVELTG